MTDQNSSRESWIVTNPPAAAFLTDPARRPYFLPFLGRVVTVSKAAAELQINVNVMLYRVQQMLDLGLLCEDHLERRAGRAIRHYKSASSSCFVPFAATPFETRKAQVKHSEFVQHQVFAQALGELRHAQMSREDWGTRIERDPIGTVTVSPARLDPMGGISVELFEFLSVWSELHLNTERTHELELRLRDLLADFTQQPEEKAAAKYLLHIGFVPLAMGNNHEDLY